MLDFSAVDNKTKTVEELVANLTLEDLGELTNEMVDKMQSLIADCEDFDVSFEPRDPEAHDSFA